MTLCARCDQPIRRTLMPEGWRWEHVPEFAGRKDHQAQADDDPGRRTP